MQQGQKTSKKWVDFSDQSEEQIDSDGDKPGLKHTQSTPVYGSGQNEGFNSTVDHRSEQFIQLQLKKFNQARQKQPDIWILLESEDQQLLDKKIKELKEGGNRDVINIYVNRDVKNGWDLKVNQALLEIWIKEGLDKDRKIKLTVSNRNFRSRDQGDRPRGDRRGRGRGDRDRGDRGDRRGRGDRGGRREGGDRRRDRDNNTEPDKKKVYVDKNTGKAPSNKVQTEQQVIQQKQRHYTKQQAQRVGSELGNFRNKPKTQNPTEVKVEQIREVRQIRRPKEEVKSWVRKQDKKEEKQELKDKKVEYREKAQQQAPVVPQKAQKIQKTEKTEKKKTYVRVDNLPEKQKEQLKYKTPKNSNGLLDEDSN